ncbi:hypothetical protein PENTCL1PPCAC_15285, partial [Pristionchus entomophagus]
SIISPARSLDYEIYDASSISRSSVAPKNVVIVLGAKRFVVKADKGPQGLPGIINSITYSAIKANSFTARLVGFDNAQENNVDGCTYAFKTPTFEGFEYHVNGPIISIVFDKKNPITLNANYNWLSVRDLDKSSFLATPGFHGCAKVNQLQIFHEFNGGFYGEDFDLHAEPNLRVIWDIDSNLTSDLIIKDMTNSKR